MKELEVVKVITYRWWRSGRKGKIKPEHVAALNESAEDRIGKMLKDGYAGGELSDHIHTTSRDPADGVEYSGWWEVKPQEPAPRLGYKLNVEMTYDDYSPCGQETPSRLERLAFATRDQLLEAQDLITALCERHRNKVEQFFSTYEEFHQIVMGDGEEYDAAARGLFYEMAENYGVKKRTRKPEAHA
jgi:hypothetical protein